jgi:hypothetical protein
VVCIFILCLHLKLKFCDILVSEEYCEVDEQPLKYEVSNYRKYYQNVILIDIYELYGMCE